MGADGASRASMTSRPSRASQASTTTRGTIRGSTAASASSPPSSARAAAARRTLDAAARRSVGGEGLAGAKANAVFPEHQAVAVRWLAFMLRRLEPDILLEIDWHSVSETRQALLSLASLDIDELLQTEKKARMSVTISEVVRERQRQGTQLSAASLSLREAFHKAVAEARQAQAKAAASRKQVRELTAALERRQRAAAALGRKAASTGARKEPPPQPLLGGGEDGGGPAAAAAAALEEEADEEAGEDAQRRRQRELEGKHARLRRKEASLAASLAEVQRQNQRLLAELRRRDQRGGPAYPVAAGSSSPLSARVARLAPALGPGGAAEGGSPAGSSSPLARPGLGSPGTPRQPLLKPLPAAAAASRR